MGVSLVKKQRVSRYALAKSTRSRARRTIKKRRAAQREATPDRIRWRASSRKPTTIRSDNYRDDPHLLWLAARSPDALVLHLGLANRLSAALSALSLARDEIELLRANLPPTR